MFQFVSIFLCGINGFESDWADVSGFLVKPFHRFQSCVFDNETCAAVNNISGTNRMEEGVYLLVGVC